MLVFLITWWPKFFQEILASGGWVSNSNHVSICVKLPGKLKTCHFHSLFQVSPGSSLKNNWVEEIQEILKLGLLMSIFVCAITCTHAHCQSPWFYKKKPYEVTSSHIKMGWRIRIFNGIQIHKQPSTECVSSKRFSSDIKAYFIFDFIQFQASAQNFYTPESIHQYFAGESKGPNNNKINAINNNNNNTDLTTTT